jgi:DNA-binding LacI/PurR family transcriptional regulator
MNIRDFSARIGLSTATVSRAFSGKGPIDPSTRQRVLAEAERHNFQPNVHAQRLSLQASGVIGLYYGFAGEPIFDYYNMELAQEIAKAARAAGLGLHLELAPRQEEPRAQLASLAGRKVIDGLILVSDGPDGAEPLLAAMRSTPTVIVSGQAWEVPPGHAQVVIDFEPGIVAAVEHLVAAGHRRIGYLRGAEVPGKVRALRRALHAHGLELEENLDESGNHTFAHGERAYAHWRARGVTAVIGATDILAMGMLRAAAASGVSVPRDFSIVGIDDLAFSAYSVPALSSVGILRRDIAHAAIGALRRLLEATSPVRVEPIFTPTSFVPRESSAAVPA